VYFTILFSHTVLAAAIVPLVFARSFERFGATRSARAHRALDAALWLYVSITGVLIYWLLYHLYPSA